MSTYQGSKLTTNGLVFAMDMNNTQKSFKGKPTINYWYENGGGGATTVNVDDLPDVEQLARLVGGKGNIKDPRRQSTQTNWLDLYNSSSGITVDPGETLSISCYIYTTKSTNRFNGNGNWGVDLGTNAGMYSNPDTHNIDPYVWRRFRFSKTNTTNTAISVTSTRIETYSTDEWSPDTIDAYGANPQWEVSTFATPFVNGTRDANSTIVDLTRNHSVSANSVTYNSNNTFSFGGSDYIRLANAGAVDFTNKSFSVGVWFKKADTNQRSIFGHLEVNETGKSIHYRSYANGALRFDFYGGNVTVADQIVTDTWYYTTTTYDYDSGTTILYLNGESIGSGSVGPYIGNSTTSTTYIGAWQPSLERWNGEVPVVHIYDRAITSTEVKNNFNAYRSRYGV
jgi:hypothetical protein